MPLDEKERKEYLKFNIEKNAGSFSEYNLMNMRRELEMMERFPMDEPEAKKHGLEISEADPKSQDFPLLENKTS